MGDQLLYPEILGTMWFVNAGTMLTTFWKVVSSWLDARTNRKIRILGGEFLQELQIAISDEAIPIFLGGKLEGNHVSNRDNPTTQLFSELDSYCAAQAAAANANGGA